MTCCGEKILNMARKAGHVIEGNIKHTVDTAAGMVNLTPPYHSFSQDRLEICRECEKHTWMTWTEYAGWVGRHLNEVVLQFDRLEEIPELPKQEKQPKRTLFCRVCKCLLPAKAAVENETCPLYLWEK